MIFCNLFSTSEKVSEITHLLSFRFKILCLGDRWIFFSSLSSHTFCYLLCPFNKFWHQPLLYANRGQTIFTTKRYDQIFNNDQYVCTYEKIWVKTLILINVGSLFGSSAGSPRGPRGSPGWAINLKGLPNTCLLTKQKMQNAFFLQKVKLCVFL